MFDRFTDRANKVMSLAKADEPRLNHPVIDADRMRLGLIKESEGIAARALLGVGVKFEETRDAIVEFLDNPPRRPRDE